MKRRLSIIGLAISTLFASRASAVILVDQEARNTSPPPGSLAAAWNLQGRVGAFTITPISPKHFITANHIGFPDIVDLQVGSNFYTTTGATRIANTDLKVYTISGTFSSWATLYDESVDGPEVGKAMAVFGRGTQRGPAVVAPIPAGPTATPPTRLGSSITPTGASPTPVPSPTPSDAGSIRGWRFGNDSLDGVLSWGRNVVDSVEQDSNFGELLSFSFSNGASKVANEAGLFGGDSGGGLFIFSQGQWKLAGVNLGIDGPFSTSPDGPYFNGLIFDARGLYVGSRANHMLVPNGDGPVEGSSYSSRLGGANLSAIRNLIAGSGAAGGPMVVPEPTTVALVAGGALLASRRQRSKR